MERRDLFWSWEIIIDSYTPTLIQTQSYRDLVLPFSISRLHCHYMNNAEHQSDISKCSASVAGTILVPRRLSYIYIPSFLEALSVYLVERSGIRKTRIPDFIHHLYGVYVVLTTRSRHNRPDCSRPYTVLMLLRDCVVIPREELARPSTFST